MSPSGGFMRHFRHPLPNFPDSGIVVKAAGPPGTTGLSPEESCCPMGFFGRRHRDVLQIKASDCDTLTAPQRENFCTLGQLFEFYFR